MNIQRQLSTMISILSILFSVHVLAAADTPPDKVVAATTEKLFSVVKGEQELLTSNPDKFFSDVHSALTSAVDFDYISKQVMGKDYWPKATAEQRKQFAKVFTTSLVKTYGKGIVNFVNYESNVELSKMSEDGTKAWVIQSIKLPEKVSKVAYLMQKEDDGWKAVNVVLDGAKLMETFRNQFAAAVQQHNGIAGAIDNWAAQ